MKSSVRTWLRCGALAVLVGAQVPAAVAQQAEAVSRAQPCEAAVIEKDESRASALCGALAADGSAAPVDRARAHVALGRLEAVQRNRPAEAAAQFGRAIAVAPQSALGYSGRAKFVHVRAGRLDLALADLDAAIRIEPKLLQPHLERAGILLLQGDDTAFQRALFDALPAMKETPGLREVIGIVEVIIKTLGSIAGSGGGFGGSR